MGGKPLGEGEAEGGDDGDIAEETDVADVLDARWEQGEGCMEEGRVEEKWVSERLLGTLVRMGTLLTESLPLERSKEFRWALVWRTVESGLAGSFGGAIINRE